MFGFCDITRTGNPNWAVFTANVAYMDCIDWRDTEIKQGGGVVLAQGYSQLAGGVKEHFQVKCTLVFILNSSPRLSFVA